MVMQSMRPRNEKNEQDKRLAALGETTIAVVDGIRDPLDSIRDMVSLLSADMNDQPLLTERLRKIDRCVEDIDRVVTNVRHYSEDAIPELEVVDLHRVLFQVLDRLSDEFSMKHPVALTLRARPQIWANESLITEALFQILKNAIEATAGQGKVFVTTEDTSTGDLRVIVRGTGPGVAREVMHSLFDPFITTKGEGRGIGLAVAMRVIADHHGSIAVHNRGGAEFFITLRRGSEQSS